MTCRDASQVEALCRIDDQGRSTGSNGQIAELRFVPLPRNWRSSAALWSVHIEAKGPVVYPDYAPTLDFRVAMWKERTNCR